MYCSQIKATRRFRVVVSLNNEATRRTPAGEHTTWPTKPTIITQTREVAYNKINFHKTTESWNAVRFFDCALTTLQLDLKKKKKKMYPNIIYTLRTY